MFPLVGFGWGWLGMVLWIIVIVAVAIFAVYLVRLASGEHRRYSRGYDLEDEIDELKREIRRLRRRLEENN